MTTYNLEAKFSPTDNFKNADGTEKVGKVAQGTKLTSTSRNGVTYKVGSVYYKYAHVTVLSIDEGGTTPPPPPPPPTKTLTHTVKVYSDGSITIDA